jgi:hypothetical protein
VRSLRLANGNPGADNVGNVATAEIQNPWKSARTLCADFPWDGKPRSTDQTNCGMRCCETCVTKATNDRLAAMVINWMRLQQDGTAKRAALIFSSGLPERLPSALTSDGSSSLRKTHAFYKYIWENLGRSRHFQRRFLQFSQCLHVVGLQQIFVVIPEVVVSDRRHPAFDGSLVEVEKIGDLFVRV